MVLKKEIYLGYEIVIDYDSDPQNPRLEWDNIGTMVCFHKRYNLGDLKHNYKKHDFNNWLELKKRLIKDGAIIVIPIYMYDHSGLTISNTPFNCHFDSGQIGYIYLTRENLLKEANKKRLSKDLVEKYTQYLIGEIETYDKFLRGEVFHYKVLDDKNDFVYSCHGYFDESDALNEAKNIVKHELFKNCVQL